MTRDNTETLGVYIDSVENRAQDFSDDDTIKTGVQAKISRMSSIRVLLDNGLPPDIFPLQGVLQEHLVSFVILRMTVSNDNHLSSSGTTARNFKSYRSFHFYVEFLQK